MLAAIRPRRTLIPALLAIFALPAVAILATARAGDADADQDVASEFRSRMALEEPLKKRVNDLLAARNEQGEPFRRGFYSRTFSKVDDSTYQVAFHEDTASKDSLLTERCLLTLKRSGTGPDWTVASREVKDSRTELYRLALGDEQFHNFDGFSLEVEGMKVSGGKGSLFTEFRQGEVQGMVVVAENLAWTLAPPRPQDSQILEIARVEHSQNLTFAPERLDVTCDSASCRKLLASFTGLQKVERASATAALRSAHEEVLQKARQDRRQDGFADFFEPFEADQRLVILALKKPTAEDYLGLTFNSLDPVEARFWASGIGTVLAWNSAATRQGGVTPYDIEKRDAGDLRDYDLQGMVGTVELGLEEAETLRGDITFVLVTKRPLRVLDFEVAQLGRPPSTSGQEARRPSLVVNSVEDENGQELTWVKTGPVSGRIVLPGEVPSETTMTLRMQFENTASIYKLTPTFSYVAREGWLPFVRYEDRINPFDLTVKVPAKYKTLGVGRLEEERTEGDTSITRWVSDSDVHFPSVVYGEYVEEEPSFKATRGDKSEIPLRLHVDRGSMSQWGIRGKQLQPLVDDAANALNLYRTIFGVEYPYGKLDLVNDPGAQGFLYGQSPASLIYIGSLAFRSEATIATSDEGQRGRDANLTRFAQGIVPHEVGHQWWGSLISSANRRNRWFIESLAEYSSALFDEARSGRKEYSRHVEMWRDALIDQNMLTSVQDGTTFFGGRYALFSHYAKGPYVFHIMRSTWGDEKFLPFLKTLAQELQGRRIVTRDIQQVAEKSFGGTMEWFFDQWVRGVGLPEYTVQYTSRPAEEKAFYVEGKILQRVCIGMKKYPLKDVYFRAVAPLTIVGRSGKEYTAKLKVEGPETAFKLKFPEEPRSVKFNDGGEVLAYDVIMKAGA